MKLFILLLLSVSQFAMAAETAAYYRVWQGFKKQDVSTTEFMQLLPSFMNQTTDLYQNVLSNYIVVIPPINKPSFIPDEFALVAINAEDNYRQIRQTPEGQNYSDAHWDVFDRNTSKSAAMKMFYSENVNELESNTAYNILEQPVDWSKGITTVYIGIKKLNLDSTNYLQRLHRHIDAVAKAYKTMGLNGYIVIANDNYEVAYMNWISREAMQTAFTSKIGAELNLDANEIMDLLQFQEASPFNKYTVEADAVYSTISY